MYLSGSTALRKSCMQKVKTALLHDLVEGLIMQTRGRGVLALYWVSCSLLCIRLPHA